jgi:hypothetical protein
MVKKVSQTIIFLLFCTFAIHAQTISAKAYIDSSSYQVGDYINLTVNVVHNQDVSLSKPVVGDSTSNFEVIDSKPPIVEKNGNKFNTTFQFTLSKYDSGEVNIARIPIYYTVKGDTTIKVAYTNPVSFVVKTLKVNLQKPIKDVKKPIRIPLNWKLIILIILIILLILAVIFYFYNKHKKKKQTGLVTKKIIERPPHVTALYELRALDEKQLWQKGLIKEYHTEITEIIRKYFHYQFFLPAMELTSTEVIDYLKKVEDAKSILDITNNFLSNADLVKFAKFQPMDSINEEMMKQAIEIVEKTKPKQTKELVTEDKNV